MRYLNALAKRYLCSRLIPLPTMLQIEISSLCNLRCVMCAKTLGYTGTPPDRLIDPAVVDRLEPVFPSLDYVDLSGVWGEALIRPGLYLDILGRLKAHRIAVRTISNGTLITPEIAAAVVRLGLDFLSISVDAARPETYRRIRKGGELEELLAGVRRVNEEKARQGRAAPAIEFLALGMLETAEEIPGVVRLAAASGASRVVVQEMADFKEVRGQSLAWGHRELGRKWYGEAAAAARESGVGISLLPPDQFEEPSPAETHKAASGARPAAVLKDCFLPWTMPIVTTTGDVIPCCTLFESMGNLHEAGFEEIWRGKAFRDLRRAILGPNPPPTCRICSARGWREETHRREVREALAIASVPVRRAFRRTPLLAPLKAPLKRLLVAAGLR
ncbi:MAG: radical SAM protein [bacterium]|nr:radical SAM protein [bacterium]